MWFMCCLPLLFLPQQSEAPAATTPQDKPAEAQAAEELTSGLRLELIAMIEMRRDVRENPPGRELPTTTDMQFVVKITGPRQSDVFRYGNVVLDELVDDTGKDLIANREYPEQMRERTRMLNIRQKLGQEALAAFASVNGTARQAKTIAKAKGYVKVILATEPEEITIENPLQYRGQVLPHPRLKELGVEIKLLPPGDPPHVKASDQYMPIQYVKGLEKVNTVQFYDGWFQEIRARATPSKTKDDEECYIFQVFRNQITEDTQLVLGVFPEIEVVRIPLRIDGAALP